MSDLLAGILFSIGLLLVCLGIWMLAGLANFILALGLSIIIFTTMAVIGRMD